ncbi:MAG: hypothetical protein KAS72_07845 [Phycisphaerales bacterium]|nr:hypothetical protein [Phycisphaerales bacterium]
MESEYKGFLMTLEAYAPGDILLKFAKSETPDEMSGVIWASSINCVQVLQDGALFVHVPGQSFRFDDSAEIMDSVIDAIVAARRELKVSPAHATETAGAPGPDTNQNPEPKVMQ